VRYIILKLDKKINCELLAWVERVLVCRGVWAELRKKDAKWETHKKLTMKNVKKIYVEKHMKLIAVFCMHLLRKDKKMNKWQTNKNPEINKDTLIKIKLVRDRETKKQRDRHRVVERE